MTTRTKRKICIIIVIFNFILMIGLTGHCELGYMKVKDYLIKLVIIFSCSIIPFIKSGMFT